MLDGFCGRCYVRKFPGSHLSLNVRNQREYAYVTHLMNQHFMKQEEYHWVHDQRMMVRYDTGGCCDTERRIDLWAVIGHTVVAIEIDEGQHKRYGDIERHEFVRYNDLFVCFGSRFIFVRINPDRYKNALGKKVPIRSIAEGLRKRRDKVDEVVQQAIAKAKTDIDPEEPMVIVWHLFFDGYPKGVYQNAAMVEECRS